MDAIRVLIGTAWAKETAFVNTILGTARNDEAAFFNILLDTTWRNGTVGVMAGSTPSPSWSPMNPVILPRRP